MARSEQFLSVSQILFTRYALLLWSGKRQLEYNRLLTQVAGDSNEILKYFFPLLNQLWRARLMSYLFWYLYIIWNPVGSQYRRRRWHPTPVLLPGKSHGWRSLVGCSPWGCEELDITEWLHFHFSLSCIGEGTGNPLQHSCLENPRDGGAWWAAVYGVAQSWTWLNRLSSSSSSNPLYGSDTEVGKVVVVPTFLANGLDWHCPVWIQCKPHGLS